jgi:MFS family permease
LINNGREEEARAILNKYHCGNDPAYADLIEFEMNEIKITSEHEKASKEVSYKAFLQTKANRHRLFVIVFLAATSQLAGNGLVSCKYLAISGLQTKIANLSSSTDYLNLILNSIGITEARRQLLINGALMAYNIATAVFAGFMCGRLPRRPNLLIGLGAMAIFYIIWTVLSAINQQRNFEQTSLGEGVLAMIFLYYAAYNFSLNALPNLYITEVLPYYLRAKGTTIYVVTQAIVLVYNGFVNPVAMDAISWRYYIVFCCLLCVELVVVWFTFPETFGFTLEETAQAFGDGALHNDHMERKGKVEGTDDVQPEVAHVDDQSDDTKTGVQAEKREVQN